MTSLMLAYLTFINLDARNNILPVIVVGEFLQDLGNSVLWRQLCKRQDHKCGDCDRVRLSMDPNSEHAHL